MTETGRLPDSFTEPFTGRRINLLNYEAANKRGSWILAIATMAILAGSAYLLAEVTGASASVFFVGIALVVGAGQAIVGFWFSDQVALSAAGARPATADEHRYLVNVAEAVAIGAGVPVPRVYVIDSPAPNAFATGRDPQHSAIAVTTGLIKMLDRQELEGVVAHEMAHIRNYDVRFMSMLVATVGALLILRDLILRWSYYGGGSSRRTRRSSSGGGKGQAVAALILLFLVVVGPLLAMLMRFAVSRRREYLADAAAAYITRNPEGLASALEKLKSQGESLPVSEGVRPLFIVNPKLNLNGNGLFATHPPIDERIRRLRSM